MISKGDATQGVGIRYSVFGHIDGEGIMDRHRVNLVHRRPLYKDWLFLEFSPQLEWKNDNDWDLVPGLLVGLDMLFWGK